MGVWYLKGWCAGGSLALQASTAAHHGSPVGLVTSGGEAAQGGFSFCLGFLFLCRMALLVLQKGSEGGPPKALLADSLKADGAPAACANELKDLLADVDKVPLTATLRWPRPLTTAVMVECLSLRRGEGPKQRGSQHSLVAELKTKLSTFTSQRKAEAEKLLEEKEEFLVDQAVQLKTASDKVQLLAKQASAAKGELSALQKAALKVVKEGAPPDVSDLGKEALLDSERIKTLGDPRVCSRCHWQSGCPSCDVFKCSRYHVRVLCRSLGKQPRSGLADRGLSLRKFENLSTRSL